MRFKLSLDRASAHIEERKISTLVVEWLRKYSQRKSGQKTDNEWAESEIWLPLRGFQSKNTCSTTTSRSANGGGTATKPMGTIEHMDVTRKMERYHASGVDACWILDPMKEDGS